ncbi:hypothetical protein BaRGS_00015493 [Batillaria attramentaria]|uniref:Uncharacterized protein n=1 Tax=Batillaria attramentaria TaxID=370345 RepID=A0ABD0L1U2_9CAEN
MRSSAWRYNSLFLLERSQLLESTSGFPSRRSFEFGTMDRKTSGRRGVTYCRSELPSDAVVSRVLLLMREPPPFHTGVSAESAETDREQMQATDF